MAYNSNSRGRGNYSFPSRFHSTEPAYVTPSPKVQNQYETPTQQYQPCKQESPEMYKSQQQQYVTTQVSVTHVKKDEVSATTKALADVQMAEDAKKKFQYKKGVKAPMAVRRKRLNARLAKLLVPKSAINVIHDIRPGSVITVQEVPGTCPSVFTAQVEDGGKMLATGQGPSKKAAKKVAAENAFKTLITQIMAQKEGGAAGAVAVGDRGASQSSEDLSMDVDGEANDPRESLPWAGLASFAMYKLFNEWGEVPVGLATPPPKTTPTKKKNANKAASEASAVVKKKELPANALNMHPTLVLNMMMPIQATDLGRSEENNGHVTMSYEVDGRTFTGSGTSKKEARKEAAKAVLQAEYGLVYPA